MNRRIFSVAALALAATLAFPALAQNVKLTLGHGAAPGNPRNEAAVKFAELVKGQVAKLKKDGVPEVAFRVAVKDGKLNFTARGLKGAK